MLLQGPRLGGAHLEASSRAPKGRGPASSALGGLQHLSSPFCSVLPKGAKLLSSHDRALLKAYLRPEAPRVVLLGLVLFAGIGSQLANPQIARTFIDRAQAGEPFQ